MKRLILLSLTLTACACSPYYDISVFQQGKRMCEPHGGLKSVANVGVKTLTVQATCGDGTFVTQTYEGDSYGTLTESTRG